MKVSVSRAICLSSFAWFTMQAYADGPSVYALIDGGVASSKITGTNTSTSQTEFVTGGVVPNFVGFKLDKTSDGLTVGVQLEQGFSLNSSKSSGSYYAFGNGDILNRQKNIFVKSSAGSFVFGVQPNIAFGNVLMGDPRGGSNYGSSLAMINGNGGLGTVDTASLSYTSPSLSGLTVGVQYVPQSSKTAGEVKTGSRLAATYANGPLTLGISNYSNTVVDKKDSTGTILAANYKLGSFTLKGISASQKTDTYTDALKTNGIGGAYALNDKTSFDIGYYKTTSGISNFKVDTTGVGAYYNITKDLKFYGQYAVVDNKGSANGVGWNFAGPTIFAYAFDAGQKATTVNAGLIFSYF